MNRPLRLYVYNNEYDVTRLVTISPHRAWGGDGALGCVLGFGALHRVPAPLTEPANAPGETLFETARFSNEDGTRPTYPAASNPAPGTNNAATPGGGGEFLVPANMQFNTTTPSPQADAVLPQGAEKKKKARAHHAVTDDYFKEGEEKSAQLDNAPKTVNAALPPPPMGGPPRAGPPRAGKSPVPASPAPASPALEGVNDGEAA